MLEKTGSMGHPVRHKLTSNGLLVSFADQYTTRGDCIYIYIYIYIWNIFQKFDIIEDLNIWADT